MKLFAPLPDLPEPPRDALDWLGWAAIAFLFGLVVLVWGLAVVGLVATAGWF